MINLSDEQRLAYFTEYTDKLKLKVEAEEAKAENESETPVTPEVKKSSNSDKAIVEIDSKIAESSEGSEHQEIEMEDYDSLSLDNLVTELGKLVKEGQVQSINSNVNKIKSIFNLKFGKLLKAEKEKFLAEGGNIIDFQYNNPIKSTYNSFLYDFKIKRNEFYSNQEAKLKTNLEEKLEEITSDGNIELHEEEDFQSENAWLH